MSISGMFRVLRRSGQVAVRAFELAGAHEERAMPFLERAERLLDRPALALGMLELVDQLLTVALDHEDTLAPTLQDLNVALDGRLPADLIPLAGSLARFTTRQRGCCATALAEARANLDADAFAGAARDLLALMPALRAHAGDVDETAANLRKAAERSGLLVAGLRVTRAGAAALREHPDATTAFLRALQAAIASPLTAPALGVGTRALRLAVAQQKQTKRVLERLDALLSNGAAPALVRSAAQILALGLENTAALEGLLAALDAWMQTPEPAAWLVRLDAVAREHREELLKLGAELLAVLEHEPHALAFATLTDLARLAWKETDALQSGLAALRALDAAGEAADPNRAVAEALRALGQGMILSACALAGEEARGETVRPASVPASELPPWPPPAAVGAPPEVVTQALDLGTGPLPGAEDQVRLLRAAALAQGRRQYALGMELLAQAAALRAR